LKKIVFASLLFVSLFLALAVNVKTAHADVNPTLVDPPTQPTATFVPAPQPKLPCSDVHNPCPTWSVGYENCSEFWTVEVFSRADLDNQIMSNNDQVVGVCKYGYEYQYEQGSIAPGSYIKDYFLPNDWLETEFQIVSIDPVAGILVVVYV